MSSLANTPHAQPPIPPIKPKRKWTPKDQVVPRKKPVWEGSLNTLRLSSGGTSISTPSLPSCNVFPGTQSPVTPMLPWTSGGELDDSGSYRALNSTPIIAETPNDATGTPEDASFSPSLSWSSSTDTLCDLDNSDGPPTRPNSPSPLPESFMFSFQLPMSTGSSGSATPSSTDKTTPPAPAPSKESKAQVALRILGHLRDAKITPLELILLILDTKNGGLENFRNRLLEQHDRIFQLLNIFKDNKNTEAAFKDWHAPIALDYVSRKVFQEVQAAKPFLKMESSDITVDFVDKWSVQDIMEPVASNITPTLTRILTVATSPTFSKVGETVEDLEDLEPGAKPEEGRNRGVARLILASQIHYLRSHWSCKVQQLNDILHQAGLSRCHSSNLNTIEMLSECGLEQARVIADGPHILAYDNVNISTSVFVEQTDNTRPKVQSGTFPVIYKAPLGVTIDHMLLEPILKRRREAPELKMTDLRPSAEYIGAFRHQTVVNIVKMLTKLPSFSSYAGQPELQHLPRHRLPDGYRTEYFPLGVMLIEEASVKGNNQVIDDIYVRQLLKDIDDLAKRAVISINDQLTNSRIRSCQVIRKNDFGRYNSREFLELAVALFHLIMNLIWALKDKHYGTIEEIASLAQLFALFLYKTRLAGAKADFHSLLTALMQILEGIILNAWEAKCGLIQEVRGSNPGLAYFSYMKVHLCVPQLTLAPSPETLLSIAKRIIKEHATPTPAYTPAYTPRKSTNPADSSTPDKSESCSDPVRENVVRLTRDLLLVIELVSAVKDGDFGRVEDVLLDLAFTFRGAGSNNYSTEILHLIHNFKYVWTPEFAEAVRMTSIINISGLPGHGMGIDLNIEHLIRYLKALFTAKGIYSKWERCGHISASINIVMLLKQRVSRSLKLGYQGSTHSKVSSAALVERMRLKAKELQLHVVVPGRTGASLKPDLRALGRQKIESSSLAAFNAKIRDIVSGACIVPPEEEDELSPPDYDMTTTYEQLKD
ncbi:hypothetical protein DFP72DRAFT_1102267 [Ephemerocybe angulata]|uniref:DUF6589 domain-containing protein n=1 Tax=Ephemerocybe angulata TaxID=980116 RepID=A0A8H6I747_9AGAR|nr:hypothetical protein DFP72DRAFT_1102267 [Tulosesus angulatus]